MKLLHSFTKPRYWVLGLGLAAGAGTAQAQFTGIGTTNPQAALHVATDTANVANYEPLRVDFLRGLETGVAAEEAKYADVVLYDASTGLFRRESIADLLDNNGEWVWDSATNTLRPRRTEVNDEISIVDGTGIGIANNLTVGGNAAVAGNGAITGTLDVTGATTLGATLDVTTLDPIGTDFSTDDRVLLTDGLGTRVRHVTVEDLVENAGFWQYTDASETAIQPRDADVSGTITINNGDIDVTGQLDVSTDVNVGNDVNVSNNLNVSNDGAIAGNLSVTEATTLDSTLTVNGRLYFADIDERASPVAGTDGILLQQSGADLVEYVTVADLLQDNGEWRVDDQTTPTYIYAYRAQVAGNDVTITQATGNVGIGTTAASDKLQIVGGGIDLDADQGVSFGAIGAIAGDGANVDLTSTGSVDVASTGVTTIQSNGGTLVTVNGEGVGIGVVAAAGRVLQTNTADGVQFGSLTQVADLEQELGADTPTDQTDDFRNVVLTDGNGVLRTIDADDLISDAGEWVYEDNGTAGITSDDRIYVRRLDGSGDDVYVDGVGNVVLTDGNAYQFGGAANQITSEALTVDGAYTVTNGGATDFEFREAGSAAPWLFHDADPGTAEVGRVGINTAAPAATLHVAGNIVASNSAVTSDRRFKKDISAVSNALEAVKALRGVSYEFRKDEFPEEHFDAEAHIGFIAQEVREILPQAVFERTDGYLTVDYGSITPVLAEAVEELAAKVERLEAENAALRGSSGGPAVGAVSTKQFRELEARLAAMDARLEAATAGRK